MSSLTFLRNRQIRDKYSSGFKNYNSGLNLDHVLSRLVCHKSDIFTIRGQESDVPPFACKFRRDSQCHQLAVANEDGDISLYDTSKQFPNNILASFTAHHNAIFDISWMPDRCELISASGDHNIARWDLASCKLLAVYQKHLASVKCVDICHEQTSIFVSGSRDGSINVWDVREKNLKKPSIHINQAHSRKNVVYPGKRSSQKDPISSISAVLFKDVNTLTSAGVADGVVKIWDLRKTYIPNSKYLPSPKYQISYSDGSMGHGCTSLTFDSSHRTLYACSTNNKILKFNCHSYTKEVDVYEGFKCTTYFIKLAISSDDQYLVCGSSDEKAYIWKTSKPGLPIVKLGAHRAEVTSVCWSPYDFTKLVTCGDDNKVAIWKIGKTENPCTTDEEILAVAEPYSTEISDPKNESLPAAVSVQSSSTVCSIPKKKSPVLHNQTPNRPTIRSIKSFFSPVTPTSASSSSSSLKDIQNAIGMNGSSSPSPPSNKLLSKSPNIESPSQVLTPSNHVNKSANNLLHESSNDNTEIFSNVELKNSTPENKSNSPSFISSSLSVQNKENSSTSISPETIYKRNNAGQTKRKITPKNSTPKLKRKHSESSKKTKGLDKKTSEKTIENYFSVAVSPDN